MFFFVGGIIGEHAAQNKDKTPVKGAVAVTSPTPAASA
jgi:hypothetical protein